MAEVRFLPPAAKFLKKLKDQKLKALYREAIDRICADHTVGEPKRGDLSGIYGYDMKNIIIPVCRNKDKQNLIIICRGSYGV